MYEELRFILELHFLITMYVKFEGAQSRFWLQCRRSQRVHSIAHTWESCGEGPVRLCKRLWSFHWLLRRLPLPPLQLLLL